MSPLERIDDYYDVEYTLVEWSPGYWHGRAAIIRTDTGERISGGVGVRGTSREEVNAQVRQHVRGSLSSLVRPPIEWGEVEVRLLLRDYVAYRDSVVRHITFLKKKSALSPLSDNDISDSFHELRVIVERMTVELATRLTALPNEKLVQVVASPSAVFENRTDPWSLDDIRAREALFHFVINPSIAVASAHERHLQQIAAG